MRCDVAVVGAATELASLKAIKHSNASMLKIEKTKEKGEGRAITKCWVAAANGSVAPVHFRRSVVGALPSHETNGGIAL